MSKQQVTELYISGKNPMDISRDLGIPFQTVYYYLDQAGLRKSTSKEDITSSVKEKEKQIVELYNLGYNSVEIADKLGFKSSTSVRRYYAKLGLEANRNRIAFSKTEIDNIVKTYNDGATMQEIANMYPDKFSSGQQSVTWFFKRYGIEARRTGFDSNVQAKDYFLSVDNERKAYFLGLLMADGNVTDGATGGKAISLPLYGEDGYLVEEFGKEIGCPNIFYHSAESNAKRSGFSSSNSTVIRFGCVEMAADLAKYDVVNCKTGLEKIPILLCRELTPHFIRGYFDGDGTVYWTKDGYVRFGVYGSHLICQQILDYFGWNNKVHDQKTYDVSFFLIQKKSKMLDFYNAIYTNATIWMNRKRNIFDEYLFNG